MAMARLPSFSISFATGSRCSSLRLARATSAPARANSIAIDLPMPVPPPVMIAVLPSRENGEVAMAGNDTTLLRERDLRLAARHVALHAPPHVHRREGGAVPLRALRELVDERARLRAPAPRRLRLATNVVVVRALGFDPRLLEMRDEKH